MYFLINTKMTLSLSCVAILLVHYSFLTVSYALPVTQTATTQETDVKQAETPVEVNTLGMGIAESQLSSNEFNHTQANFSNSDEKKEKEAEYRACKIFNVTYQHKEQIPRNDPCEMCVCVDSEMFCFWKLCAFLESTTVKPLTSISPINYQQENHSNVDRQSALVKLNANDVQSNEVVETNEKYAKILTDQRKYNLLKKLETTSSKNSVTGENTSTESSTTLTVEPAVCYVMGVTYKYGEVLPKDTGTCLECSCSDGGRVTCSPKDCVSQPDLDYLSHNNNMDMFDIDTF